MSGNYNLRRSKRRHDIVCDSSSSEPDSKKKAADPGNLRRSKRRHDIVCDSSSSEPDSKKKAADPGNLGRSKRKRVHVCDSSSSEPDSKKKAADPGIEDRKKIIIRDPIHGSIELNPLLLKIINTFAFNRLRYIKQLGGLSYVYPGATHTRFEHSIGVCYLAGEYGRMLKRSQPKLGITNQEILCLEVAGLCHDLGHGPFSHLFDAKVLPKLGPKGRTFEHEDLSLMIFEHIFEELNEYFDGEKIGGSTHLNIIKDMIHPNKDKLEKEKRYFLYEIVANKATGIDVDKWDYFIRDCHYTGLKCEFDYRRLMQLTKVKDVNAENASDRKYRICYAKKEATNILAMFRTRCSLHDKAYKHKTCNSVEERLATAMISVKDVKLVCIKNDDTARGSTEMSMVDIAKRLAEEPPDLKGYFALTDDIIHIILNKAPGRLSHEHQKSLEKAKECIYNLFERRIFHRIDHPDVVKDKSFTALLTMPRRANKLADNARKAREAYKMKFEVDSVYSILDSGCNYWADYHEENVESDCSTARESESVYDITKRVCDTSFSSCSPQDLFKKVLKKLKPTIDIMEKEKKKIVNEVLLQILPYCVEKEYEKDPQKKGSKLRDKLFFEKVKLSYGSEKDDGKGPLLSSELLFFSKDSGDTPKPLEEKEASKLFLPQLYKLTDVWIYCDIDEKDKEAVYSAIKGAIQGCCRPLH